MRSGILRQRTKLHHNPDLQHWGYTRSKCAQGRGDKFNWMRLEHMLRKAKSQVDLHVASMRTIRQRSL
jgi:hypothetical protein